MQVYNAVIVSKLIYGSETMYLNDSLLKRLDAFHVRGLRHILGIEHSYWSRVTNDEVIDKANRELNKGHDITKHWSQFKRGSIERKEEELGWCLNFEKTSAENSSATFADVTRATRSTR